MKSSKERKHERKRARERKGAARTDASRTRRLNNKAKRDEIHAIDPDAKIVIINGVPYIDDVGVRIINGKIVSSAIPEDAVIEYQEVIDMETNVIEKIEKKNRNALQRLTDKLRGQ